MNIRGIGQSPVKGIGEIVGSTVDGPGFRAVVHFAGCAIGCPGCFNPHTHDPNAPAVWTESAKSISDRMLAISSSVTISGGEPTDQPGALLGLLYELRAGGADIVLFSGRTLQWLRRRPWFAVVERDGMIDVLIDGPFMRGSPESVRVAGSSNQRLHFYSDRWSERDFARQSDAEFSIDTETGKMTLVGFPDEDIRSIFG